MVAYRFRLETLLNVRRLRFEIAESDLVRRLAAVRNARSNLEELSGRKKVAEEHREQHLAQGVSAGEYQLETEHIQVLAAEEMRLAEELSRLEIAAQNARHTLTVRHREKELVEKLRQRNYAAHLAEEQKQDQKEADGVASMRHEKKER